MLISLKWEISEFPVWWQDYWEAKSVVRELLAATRLLSCGAVLPSCTHDVASLHGRCLLGHREKHGAVLQNTSQEERCVQWEGVSPFLLSWETLCWKHEWGSCVREGLINLPALSNCDSHWTTSVKWILWTRPTWTLSKQRTGKQDTFLHMANVIWTV